MSGQPMDITGFFELLASQKCQNISDESRRYIQKKYCQFREFEWQLGGILIGIIEQNIFAQKNSFSYVIEQFKINLLNSKVNTRNLNFYQSYFVTIKQILESFNMNLLSQKIKDLSFQSISEKILKEQLIQSQKFKRFPQLSQPSTPSDSGNYIQPEILQYLSEILQSKITLIKYNSSIKQFCYQSFQSVKRETNITIYQLPKSLIVCLRQKSQVNNQEAIGDGFISITEVRYQSNQLSNYNSNTNNINRTIISAQGNNRESNYQPTSSVDNMKLCDACYFAFDKSLLFKNELFQPCVKCNKDIQQGNFYYDNCAHIFCQDCICNKYRENQQYKLQAKCDQCSQLLDIQKIKQFINKKQDSSQKKCMYCDKIQPEGSLLVTQLKFLNQSSNRQPISPSKQNKDNNLNKDQLSQSINFQDGQPKSQNILPIEQSSHLKPCVKCNKLNPISIIFSCNHRYCLQCICEIQRIYSNLNQVQCIGQSCQYNISISDISYFIINQNKSKQENPQNINQLPSNQSISITDQNKYSQNISDILKCQSCRNKFRKEQLFFVQGCQHSFCLECCSKKFQEADQIKCFQIGCKSFINFDDVEEFHFQQQMRSSQQYQGKNEQKFDVVCSYCKKQDIINSTQKPDYFKCSSCQKVTCLVHQGQVPQCRCYCEKCGNQCKISENTVMCPKCNYSYCMNCKQTEVGNKICQCICEFCGAQLKISKQLCKCIENVCSICLNSFENVQLNSSDDSLLRKNQQCIHFYCNICYYKKVALDTQSKQFGNLKFQCLFC
ncbi:hypothetical protein ABPG72_007148 [Tetrahymena utriculariae]